MKLSEKSRYYLINFVTVAVFWLIFIFLEFDFINITFFVMAYIWHFSLMAPGVREKILIGNTRFSFLSITIRLNYYLQLFLPTNKIPYGPSFVRALSPLLFAFLLLVAGGAGNLYFPLLGSFIFEIIYLVQNKSKSQAIIKEHKDDREIPPAIPIAENSHE